MTATSTPIPVGTDIAESINDKAFSRALLFDPTGADAMGVVGTTPAPLTMLGRLKAIATAIGDLAASFGLTTSADSYKALSASNTALTPIPKAIYVTGGGTITVVGADDVQAVFTLDDKSVLNIRPRKITAATATGIIGLY